MSWRCSLSRSTTSLVLVWSALGLSLAAEDQPERALIGTKIENFRLHDQEGKAWSLHEVKDAKAVVLVFLSIECPMSNNYLPKLADLSKSFGPKGVVFAGVNANLEETDRDIAAHRKSFQVPFPVLKDRDQAAATALKARVNPEAFVLDAGFVLRYRGRIDDAYSARLVPNARVGSHDLRQAIEEVLAGKPVTTSATVAFGCPILAPRTAARTDGKVTFNRDVLPILQNHCQTCHRPGEVGPFSLLTHTQAVKWGSDIKDYTQSRKMPPWKPDGGHGLFQNERKLTDQEIATLAQWVDQGMPEGEARDRPPERTFKDDWYLGQPDLVLETPAEMTIGPSGRDLFRCFVLPTNLTEDRYVAAFEVRPGNRRVVHHTLNIIDVLAQGRGLEEKEKAREKASDEQDRGPGYSVQMGVGFVPRGSIGGWAPGQVPRYLPDGVGYLLPKGSDLVLQVHYHRTGREEKDRTRVGLYFAKKPVTHRFQPLVLPGRFLIIPAGEARFKVEGSMWVDQDIDLYTVMPHMHLLGRDIQTTMTFPDGTTRTLVHIKDWDYNWQETYYFKEPLRIPAGTRFDVTAYYDNTAKNPRNPNDPPRPVLVGEQTTNEMCFVFFGATSDQPGRIRGRFSPLKKDEKKD
jgi:peroxiredoxin